MATLPKPQFSIWQAISAFAELCLRNSARLDALQRQPGPAGPQGPPGEKGKDGFDMREVKWECEDGGRTIAVTMLHQGMPVERQQLKTDLMLYRGLWHDGFAAERGDVVTYNGSMWVASGETKERPGSAAKAWRLSVKCGRDGKDK